MKAQRYSEIGPIERGEAVSLNTGTQLALNGVARDYECAKCGSGLHVGFGYDETRPSGQRTLGYLRCMADGTHRGIRRCPPPNRPLTPDEIEERGMLHWRKA